LDVINTIDIILFVCPLKQFVCPLELAPRAGRYARRRVGWQRRSGMMRLTRP